VDLANSLAQRGHHIYAALAPASPLLKELFALSKFNTLIVQLRNSLDIVSALRLAHFIREREIEIIHAHVARDYPLAALASRLAGNMPLVLTRHVLFPLKNIHKLTLRHVSRVIAVSQAVTDVLDKQRIFAPHKVVTIPNGIDTKRFAKKIDERSHLFNKTGAPLLAGMVGHLAPIKGQEEFIRAAAIIASQRADIDFVIAGEDKSRTGENRAAIEVLIAELDLGKRVHLTGWLDDVRDLLWAIDLFVSPSRSEPFGLAIIEAMASGVPVVASLSEGAREIIEDGTTGRLVPIGDAEALAKVIAALLADPAERKRLSANAHLVAHQHFSLERMVAATEQLYQDVITNGGRS